MLSGPAETSVISVKAATLWSRSHLLPNQAASLKRKSSCGSDSRSHTWAN